MENGEGGRNLSTEVTENTRERDNNKANKTNEEESEGMSNDKEV